MEAWKKIESRSGKHWVSNLGRVKSYCYKKEKGKILKLCNRSGYLGVCLGYREKVVLVHRLVFETFVGPIDKGMHINHKDGIKHNNHLSNLEIVTPKENAAHAVKMGFYKRGESVKQSKLTESDVLEIRKLYNDYAFSLTMIAEMFSVNRTTIHRIANKITWSHID